MKRLILAVTLIVVASACSRVKETTKEVINKSGEVVGEGASEFIEGVSEGVDRTLDCEIIISQSLKEKGIESGKFSVNNDSTGGQNNILTIYLIFNNDFSGDITAKAIDKKGLEFGRNKIKVEGVAGQATYVDFVFDQRTYIEVRSKIYLE